MVLILVAYPIAVVEIMKEKASNHVWKYKVKSCCQDRTFNYHRNLDYHW